MRETRSPKPALHLQKLAKDILATASVFENQSYWCKRVSDLNRQELFAYCTAPLAVLVSQGILEKVILARASRAGGLLPDRYFKGYGGRLDHLVHAYIVREKVRLARISSDEKAACEFLGLKYFPPPPPPTDLQAALKKVREDIEKNSDPRRRFLEVLEELMPRRRFGRRIL